MIEIVKGFTKKFKVTNLDSTKTWTIRAYTGSQYVDAITEWRGTELECTLSSEQTATMQVGFYNLIIFEGDTAIPPKCNVFKVIDAKNGGC